MDKKSDKRSSADDAPTRTAGAAIDDSVVTTKVKAALLSDAEVKSRDISVETRRGEVMLSGFVSNQRQADRAVQVARGVDGVQAVNNKLAVRP